MRRLCAIYPDSCGHRRHRMGQAWNSNRRYRLHHLVSYLPAEMGSSRYECNYSNQDYSPIFHCSHWVGCAGRRRKENSGSSRQFQKRLCWVEPFRKYVRLGVIQSFEFVRRVGIEPPTTHFHM